MKKKTMALLFTTHVISKLLIANCKTQNFTHAIFKRYLASVSKVTFLSGNLFEIRLFD